ncbi:MAG TPA: glutathione S-transferase [Acetobacteraceae bacterium]|nr:glutathione S-transferase [Acetobacteraceae bacterium]
MIIVHHLNASRSQRILWLLEELGLEYQVKNYTRDAKTMLAPASLRAVHPLGKSPVITDGDRTIAESAAIVEYLIDVYGQGRFIPPAGSAERLAYTYWLHHAEGSAMPPLVMKLVFSHMPSQVPGLIRPVARAISKGVMSKFLDPNIGALMTLWESTLGATPWFAGTQITGADILMSFPVEASMSRGAPAGGFPNLARFLNTIKARPAYQRALAKGGPFELLS